MERNGKDQTMAITGAASGPGRSIATHFASLGATILGIDRSENDLARLQEEISSGFHPISCDVTDAAAFARVFADHPVVDVLINSAGITGKTNIKSYETDPADVSLPAEQQSVKLKITSADIANHIFFYLSDLSRASTGHNWVVDDGWLLE